METVVKDAWNGHVERECAMDKPSFLGYKNILTIFLACGILVSLF
jgi:hypothetical protein